MKQSRKGNGSTLRQEPLWHWLVAAAGALLLLGTAGYLLYCDITAPPTPPAIRLQIIAIQRQPDGYLASIQAVNTGGQTAAQVQVMGSLMRGGTAIEEHEYTYDYLPPQSPRRGGLFFRQAPDAPGVHLELQASGYTEP